MSSIQAKDLRISISTCKREPRYIHETLGSLLFSSPLIHSVGSIDIFVDTSEKILFDYEYLKNIKIHYLTEEQNKAEELRNKHARFCFNYHRCLNVDLSKYKGVIVLEDDVIVREKFVERLLDCLNEMDPRVQEFVLTLCMKNSRVNQSSSYKRGIYYSSYPANYFYGTQGVYYAKTAPFVAKILKDEGFDCENAPKKPGDLLIKDYVVAKQNLYSTKFDLVDHIGAISTGLGGTKRSDSFYTSWPFQQEKLKSYENNVYNWSSFINCNKRQGKQWYYGLQGEWWWGLSETQYIDTICSTTYAKKLELHNVTLLIVDCVEAKRAERAIEVSKYYADFGAIKFLTNLETKSIHKVNIEKIKNITEYSNFCIKKMNDYVDTDYVLIVQHDGFILNPASFDKEFFSYDYIGGWWQGGYMNGGFCLRSKKLLQCLQNNEITLHNESEDYTICVRHRDLLSKKYGIKYANKMIIDKFSIDGGKWTNEFGYHGLGADIKKWRAPLCAY